MMSTGKHYFIEENNEGKFAVRAKGSQRASRLADTQKEAADLVKQSIRTIALISNVYEIPRQADGIAGEQSDHSMTITSKTA
jgi:hypothetical protein